MSGPAHKIRIGGYKVDEGGRDTDKLGRSVPVLLPATQVARVRSYR